MMHGRFLLRIAIASAVIAALGWLVLTWTVCCNSREYSKLQAGRNFLKTLNLSNGNYVRASRRNESLVDSAFNQSAANSQ